MTEPIEYDLTAFIAGDLPPEDMARVAAALDADPVLEAKYERLLETIVALDGAAPVVTSPNGDAGGDTGSRSRPRRLPWTLAGAAAVLVALAFAAGVVIREDPEPAGTEAAGDPQEEEVRLRPLADGRGAAVASMQGSGEVQEMLLDASSLPPAPEGHHYEVWLLTDGEEPMPVGILSGTEGRYAAPESITTQFDVIDVSLEPDDADPTHSGVSVLRGGYS